MPDANQTFALECSQVYEEASLQALIHVRVRYENGEGWGLGHRNVPIPWDLPAALLVAHTVGS
jgi:hypothetical protein